MDGIKIQVTGNIAKVTEKPKRIIAGTIGLPVEFYFDETWDDIVKTAVFVAGENVSRLDEIDGKTTVPWEVLQKPGPWLSIGVYGESIDGEKTIPTTWANVSPILFGTSLSGDPTDPSAAPIWKKLKDEMENVRDLVEEGYISNASINKNGELELTFLDGSAVNVGKVVGETPAIADDLYTKDSDMALSANMGAALREKIDNDLLTVQKELQAEIKQRVKTVNGTPPDASGNVVVEVPESGGPGTPGADGFSPVAKVTQTENGAVVSITDKNGTTTATIVNGKDGVDGQPGKDGAQGIQGEQGPKGDTGAPGADGAKGDKGDKGDTGAQGNPGKDGVSATHSWNGTTLTITSASGTSSANLKGEKGDKGDQGIQGIQGIQGEKGDTGAPGSNGKDGANGTSVTVKSVSESTADGGNNVVTFSDGKTVTIKNGSKGSTGSKGDKGDTGATGQRGTGLLAVTTAPSGYTTAVGGITPKYRMAISTIKTQAGVTEVLLGDTVRYSYYHYPIDYLDASYAYFTERVSIRGATGAAGKDAVLTMFVSPDGNDSNDGLTASTPKKTVAACVTAGAKRISAKRGVYAEQVAISGIDHLEIFPTDNNQEYSTSTDWHPIVFDLSDTISVGSLAAYNSIKRVAYSNSANEQFDKVFTKKSQTPVGDEYGCRYNATIWLLSNDEKTVCKKLKPVLTVAECEAESNTFTWVSNYIYINADLAGVEKVCVPTNFDSGFRIADAGKVILREVEVRFSGSYNVWLLNCPYFDFYKVSARYSSYASGIDIDNANGTLTACYATKNFDGFGISGYGHTTYIDCVSEFNFDDGVSHHNGSCGTFIGGRYEGNGKGGNTPAYGAQVNIYGGIYKDNAQFGIGYLYTSGKNPAGGMVQGAVMAGNPVGLNVDKNCAVTAINCLYKDNTADKSIKGTLTEYNPPVSGGSDEPGETGPVNLLPLAINSDGTLYVGTNGEKGYKAGWRLNSSGVEKEQTGCCVSGFIPAKKGEIVRIENYTPHTGGYGYLFTYKSDFTKYGDAMSGTVMANNTVDGVLEVDIATQFAGAGADNCAYIRFSCAEITENTIVTVTPKS